MEGTYNNEERLIVYSVQVYFLYVIVFCVSMQKRFQDLLVTWVI